MDLIQMSPLQGAYTGKSIDRSLYREVQWTKRIQGNLCRELLHGSPLKGDYARKSTERSLYRSPLK